MGTTVWLSVSLRTGCGLLPARRFVSQRLQLPLGCEWLNPIHPQRLRTSNMTDNNFFALNSTGPFVVAGWLACFGTCSGTGATVFNNCQKAKGNTAQFHYFGGGDRKRDVTSSAETCHQMSQWTFQCPAQGTGLLDKYNCEQTINT